MAETVYLLLGSNLGHRERHLAAALDRLEELEGFEVVASSPIYLSDAVDMPEDSPSFLNQVIKGEYQYPARELLHSLEKIESDLGRTDKTKNQSRTIDIDILLFGEQQFERDDLTIPHPRLLERPFALVPLVAIDPDLTHPVTGRPFADHIDSRDAEQILLYKDHVSRNV
ncbi:2-amino-4-hydroxy-6-hydroxymethyldihydropteridine diphosphokinase [candidate division GN15 bacterium]|nr:2-amino-4-hydroxy-6-hydroxymethyldihydropteridine diphosphokinase [candidate division GN15 bacterium]